MKKYFLLSVLSVLVLVNRTYAGTVSVSDAQTVAVNFFKTKSATTAPAMLIYTKTSGVNSVDFYVFDMSPATGFVIVAGDDNVIPVLAYSTTNVFRTDFKKTGLNHWVNKTAANIELALRNNAVADTRIQGQWSGYLQGTNTGAQRSSSVTPLCMTRWDQENDYSNPPPYLYNLLCPYNAADTQRALTGCVATAMAQIMKYWNYPNVGNGSYTYTDTRAQGYSNNYGIQSSDFATHAYQWSLMIPELTGSETAAQDSAVDVLMYDCAVSVGMDFGDDNEDGSGANALLSTEISDYGDSICSQYAFVNYFSYDPDTINGIIESDYTASQWTALIEHDLDMSRPILYEGYDSTQGGHAWVCDGYDVNNKLHMNWGWSGAGNGYFAINDLTTNVGGTFDPIVDDDALIGIIPRVTDTVSATHPSGITAVNSGFSFAMYPNPAANDVVLTTTESIDGLTWNVKNTLGQTLISKSAVSDQTHIDLATLANGMYMIELQAGDKSAVRKLVVSR